MLGLTKDHLDFFHRHKFIELEELMTEDEVHTINAELNGQKYDVWRTSEPLKKIILKRSIAGIASQLSKVQPIRIAYDRLIEAPIEKEPLNLIEMSSIRRVISGVVIQLGSYDGEDPLVPKKRGSGVFFTPFHPLTFPDRCKLLLIVYTESKALYIRETRDPNCHALKKLGYGYGDRLRSDTHPILYKR